MENKAAFYIQLADRTARQITSSYQSWTDFLTTAARLYKYPYHEQLMIYAQRPEATACADYDLWNRQMGRYIRRGSKGIALIDPFSDHPQLRYVFDVADTVGRKNSRKPNLWIYQEAHENVVSQALENHFGVSGTEGFPDQVERIANQLVNEYWQDNSRDILGIVDGSYLEGYNEFSIGAALRSAAAVSTTYCVMTRCGIEPDAYFEHEDFLSVFDFNTPQTAAALGTAISQASEAILRQIEVTVRNYERQQQSERSVTHGEQPDLHEERRLPDSQPDPAPAAGEAPGQVRQDAQDLPERIPPSAVEQPDPVRDTVQPPSGDRRDSEPAAGADDAPAGKGSGSDGSLESQRPDEVGGADEQLQGPGGGNDPDRADLRLTDEEPPIQGEQFSFFPTEAQQIAYIVEAERAENAPSAFSIPQEYIDQFLLFGSNTENHRTRIAIEYSKQKPKEDLAAFLEKTYHGGYGLQFGDTKVCAWYAQDGMHLAYGSVARYARNAQVVSWEDMAVRVGELLEQGQFATNVELAECRTFERRQLSKQLWYMSRDMSEKAVDAGYMRIVRSLRGGFPEETEKLMAFLAEPESYQAIMKQVYAFRDAYIADKDMMRFQMYNPNKLIRPLEEYTLPRREYVSEIAEMTPPQGFITEDEIETSLSGGNNVEGNNSRIYDFFHTPHTPKEKQDFLKNAYGIGGGNCALSRNFLSHRWHDSKGIRYDKPGCTRVELPWSKVAKYIDSLMATGRYFTPEALAKKQERDAKKAAEIVSAQESEQPEVKESKLAESIEPVSADSVPTIWEYNEIKSAHPEDIVLYQMGDFFEIYGEDAKQAAPVLDLHLGTRPIPSGGRVDMCGIPSHKLEENLEKLRLQHSVTVSAVSKNGSRNVYSLGKQEPPAPTKAESVPENVAQTIASVNPFFQDYQKIKKEYPDYYVLVKLNDGYFAFEKDAQAVSAQLGLETVKREVIGRRRPVTVCFLPKANFEDQSAALADTGAGLVLVAHDPNKGLETFLIRSTADAATEHPASEHPATTRALEEPVLAASEAEPSNSTVKELFEQYKLSVGNALIVDAAYVNACHNSDQENAYAEGAAAIRRIVTKSGDLQLTKLYFDMPTFHNRLHQELLDETYPALATTVTPSLYQVTQADIDASLQKWNGNADSKRAVVRYMAAHDREKDTAEWLAREYGMRDPSLPLRISVGNSEPAILSWPKVQRRIAQLIQEDRFLSREEQSIETPRYQVVAYHPIENGMDEKPDYQNLREARKAAQGYVDGTMEDDGFRYEGAAVYDRQTKDFVHVAGVFPMPEQGRDREEAVEASKDELPFPYAIGDTVYLEDGKSFIIEEIGKLNIELRDPSLAYPVFRSESRESFARLMERYPQPAPQSQTVIEPVAVYPGDKNNLPYDVVIQTLRTREPEPPAPSTGPEKALEGAAGTAPSADLRSGAENFRIVDEALGEGGPKAKFQSNIRAIALLKKLEAEGAQASPEQQEVLSRYVGWGGLADAFDPTKESWSKEYAQLKELLTQEEYEAARASTLNAHYTSPTVIRAIYEAVGNMGFETGNILEPSMGVGNFFGMLPEEMKNSRLYGVELDSVTGRIAQQLYPKANITVAGFETTDRRDFFDLAVGNVPFGQYKVNDPAYNKLGFNIHNYFFAKALDQVRPGGVVAFVTSRYTMDAKDSTVRRYLAQRADLLGAIRLPNDAFKKNAGTEVVSDIIFLQKRDRPMVVEPEWVHTGLSEEGYAVNEYFLSHPEMVLGRQASESTAHGMDYTVEPFENISLASSLHEAVQHIHCIYQEAELPDLGEGEEIQDAIPADPNVKNYSYTVVDGVVYFRENSQMVRPKLNATAEARVKAMVGLRDCVRELIDLQMDASTPDSGIREKQAELNRLYDAFSAKYGLINDRANRLAFSDDSSYYLLCALEVLDEEGKLERKADMFTKRTIKPHEAETSVYTASQALAVSIGEKARVDMAYMERLTSKNEGTIVSELQGVIFRIPGQTEPDGRPHYVTADEYLSGNVRVKLRQARQAAEDDPSFAVNVEALEKAQPKDLDASEIEVRLGATWIDKTYIQQFMYETFGTPSYFRHSIKVNYSPITAEWQVTGKSIVSQNDVAAYTTYGTRRANAYKILEDSLNLRDVQIFDTVEDADGKERRVLNAKETTLAAQKQQAIREAFRDWIWKDPERRQALVRQYNEEMNATRPREYDGSHITFGGMNPEIQLREHQKNAIAHVLYGGNTLLAHEVGAGKTFEMVAAAMESKRLGLCQKSLFVVPNHLTEQWASEFLRLYPSANILVTTKKDFETHNRKKFCARIATGDYDAIIIGHSQFEKIPISRERQERLLRDQIWEITSGIQEVRSSGGEKFTVKQLERTKRSLQAKLEKLQAEDRKDDVITFEQLGVDRMFVDESHNYKNLFLYTKMRNVAGLSTSDAQKSSDMFAKCQYLDEITGSRGVTFATGTPVSNSMTEMYSIQRYLQYERLRQLGMIHFDCWASRFGETVTALELAPEGTGYRTRTRFAKFFNLPELMNLFKEVADIKTADLLNLPTPKVEYHNIVAKPTEHQQQMVMALSERASAVHKGAVDPSVDNMLKITSDGRKLGLDQRIINGLLPDEPGTKVNQCVQNILQVWRDGDGEKLTQLVFCDISTPQAKPSQKRDGTSLDRVLMRSEPAFTVYEDIRQKLIAQGMPAEQIAFIHEANSEAKKKDLFSKVRTGQVRVLLGSTQKMGAGTNVQDRLAALHDLDCPWRPGDLQQRKGRIERQGNLNEKVHVFRYVTEGTFDAYLWQTVENKQKFISQIMTSKSPVRSCDDVDEAALSYAEIKALCAGDPRIKERMDLDVEVSKLRLMKADHQSNRFRLEDQLLTYFPNEIRKCAEWIKGFESDLQTLSENPLPKEDFVGMKVGNKTYTEKEAAGTALLDACKQVPLTSEPMPVGRYRGFDLYLSYSLHEQQYKFHLKGQMTHEGTLGADPRGNLTRMENALGQCPQRLEAAKSRLENMYRQQASAKEESVKPFPYEKEFREKSARLTELDAILNMDRKESSREETVVAKSARPSVLDGLKRPVPPRDPDRKSKQHEEVR